MAKKQAKKKKYVITSKQQFDAQKEHWNGFACGYGVHGDTKYNRRKEKENMRKLLEEE